MVKSFFDGPDYAHEAKWPSDTIVIGVDEAGRGPWAGPVVAAAFWINPIALDMMPAGLTDSKKLSALARAKIEAELLAQPHVFGVGSVSAENIDELGLLPATFKAMDRAVGALMAQFSHPVAAILVDGNLKPDLPSANGAEIETIIKGDAKSLSIAAASIMAKEDRDRQMCELDKLYPEYGFAGHKGYGTKAHRQALELYGPCPQHRRSFRPIQALISAGD